uniref:Putative conserved secreted protein n=1 Tax=Ixodes ricinus TaxID=34613 RepID=V5GKF4_IXORI
MPHCILALRLVGLVFDVYDGKKDPATLPYDQKRTALQSLPSLLEVMGHSYFFWGIPGGATVPHEAVPGLCARHLFHQEGREAILHSAGPDADGIGPALPALQPAGLPLARREVHALRRVHDPQPGWAVPLHGAVAGGDAAQVCRLLAAGRRQLHHGRPDAQWERRKRQRFVEWLRQHFRLEVRDHNHL